jgi:hypothetical protein
MYKKGNRLQCLKMTPVKEVEFGTGVRPSLVDKER